MGVIKIGILGGFSGRVANVIGASWKGIAYMRAQPLSVSNPRTVAQTANRVRFATAGELGRYFVNNLFPLNWNSRAQRMSGYNLFIKENVASIVDWDNTNWANVKMVLGDVPEVAITNVVASKSSGVVEVEWDKTSIDSYFSGPAKSYASTVIKKLKRADVPVSGTSYLSDGDLSFPLDADLGVGDEFEFYLMFFDEASDTWSASKHVTVTVQS